jgi:hypothetical protein
MTDRPSALIVHGVLQNVRGMHADGRPAREIDAALARAVDIAKDIEAERDHLRALVSRLPATPSPERSCSVCGRTAHGYGYTWIGQT